MAFTVASGGNSKEDMGQVVFVEFWAEVEGRRVVSKRSAAVVDVEVNILRMDMTTEARVNFVEVRLFLLAFIHTQIWVPESCYERLGLIDAHL